MPDQYPPPPPPWGGQPPQQPPEPSPWAPRPSGPPSWQSPQPPQGPPPPPQQPPPSWQPPGAQPPSYAGGWNQGGWNQGGWNQGPGGPGGPGGFGFPPPPPRKRGRLVALVVAGVVVLVAAVGGTAALVLTGGDDDTSRTATAGATESPTDEPTEDPTDSPTDEPTETPTEDPTPDPTPPPVGTERAKAFSFEEFDDDWDFRLGKVSLAATFEKGWDFDSCEPVQVDGAMDRLGCRRASELTYTGLDGRLQVSHIVFTMDSPRSAQKAVKKSGIQADSWKSEPETYVDGVTTGMYQTKAVNQFVILTMETHQDSVPKRQASDFLSYKASDLYGAFLFR